MMNMVVSCRLGGACLREPKMDSVIRALLIANEMTAMTTMSAITTMPAMTTMTNPPRQSKSILNPAVNVFSPVVMSSR